MKPVHIANQDGISILEVLIAMIILSMALLLLLNMAMVALDGNDWSNKTTVATQLLQEKLEQLRTAANTGLTGGSDTVGGVVRTWTVTTPGSYLRQVDVQVAWEDIRALTQTNSVSAIIRTDSI
jgi:Tfp pilus assembly protein PilV